MRYCYFPLLVFFYVLAPAYSFSQDKTQIISGIVFDQDSRTPVQGAKVFVSSNGTQHGAISDSEGKFVIQNVPIGRQIVICRYPGFVEYISEELILVSSRETYLEIFLVQSMLDAVDIVSGVYPSAPQNEDIWVSGISFNAETTEKTPAAANDPGRMALSLPGVQQGEDDSENDIIIRGNSSIGMLWRLEGLDIPSPNHFSRPGTSGGGLTVFSSQLIGRSDFAIGVMPAEYGNALSGVMDVHFRKGNKQERDYRLRLGVLGVDVAAEGPIKKGKSSYLANYRGSTLTLLNQMGFHLVGERVDNDFTDFSFNVAFDGKKGFGTVFGIGGLSRERYRPESPENRDIDISNHWELRLQGSHMAAMGATYTRNLDSVSHFKAALAITGSYIYRFFDTLDLADNPFRYRNEEHHDGRLITSFFYNRKLNSRTKFKTGLFFHHILYDFYRESAPRRLSSNINEINSDISASGNGSTQTFQYFAQITYQLHKKLAINAGGHMLFLALNRTWAVDPRVALKYDIGPKTNLSMAYGIHSKSLPMMLYFYYDQEREILPNFDLPFLKSQQFNLSFSQSFSNYIRFRSEFYVQKMINVPVNRDPQTGEWDGSNFWFLNNREAIFNPLVSDGQGLNYGVDLALEKAFIGGWFFLLTGSFFDARAILPDMTNFPSRFASRYSSSYTLGKEFTLPNLARLQIGVRVLYNGGFRYTPPDTTLSTETGSYIPDPVRLNESFVSPYFRIDSRIAYYFNSNKKWSGSITLDIQNVTDRRNIRNIGWNNDGIYFTRYPGGLIPVLRFQVDF